MSGFNGGVFNEKNEFELNDTTSYIADWSKI